MNYHDHKTFWLFIAVMIGVPSILFVLALLKATTKDPFGVSGDSVSNAGSANCEIQAAHYGSQPKGQCAVVTEPLSQSSLSATHTIQFSAVPVLDNARGSTADTKANPPRLNKVGCKGILAAAETQAVRHSRLSDFKQNHSFYPPAGVFSGVIGGPPCQAHVRYAALNRAIGNRVAPDLTPEYVRIVKLCGPEWFLMENSSLMPSIEVENYKVQAVVLNAVLFGLEQNRSRKFQFGCRLGRRIRVDVSPVIPERIEKACLASEGASGIISNSRRETGNQKSYYSPRRSWSRFCELQGVPADFLTQSPFNQKGRYKVVGNGVPLPMGRAIARAIKSTLTRPDLNA